MGKDAGGTAMSIWPKMADQPLGLADMTSASPVRSGLVSQAADTGGGSGSDLYDGITHFAVGTPSWLHAFFSAFTNYGLLIYVGLFAVAWWRARTKNNPSAMALALLAP